MEPEGEASDRNGGEEGGGVFGVTGSDAAPSCEVEERVLDQVAKFVQIFVVRPGDFPVLFGGMTALMPWVLVCSRIASVS